MHESETYQLILEERAIRGQLKVLLHFARKRLGSPSKSKLATLRSISDGERLRRMLYRLFDRAPKVGFNH